MIKFFRQLRKSLFKEGKTTQSAFSSGRYLKYAIGEIVLVVIGILIALQINNWNETRKAKIRSIEYHERIAEDLERISKTSENLNTTATKVLNSIAYTLTLLEESKDLTSEDKEIVDYVLVWMSRFNFQFSELSTYEEMKSSGDLGLIYDKNIRRDLVNFHDLIVSVDGIFNRLGATIANGQTFLDQYVKSKVDPETLEITHIYNFKEMAKDKTFINEFSRIAVHWRGNAFFTSRIQKDAKKITDQIKTELKQLND